MDSLEDFDRKFRNTFFTIKDVKEIPNNTVVEFLQYTDKNLCIFNSISYGKIALKYDHIWDKIEIFFPEIGLYNLDKTFIFFSRNPQRQWKRNPTHGNCSIESPVLSFISENKLNSRINLESFTQIKQSVFPTLKEATDLLQNQEVLGVALSTRFGLTFSQTTKLFHIWFHKTIIGTLDLKTKAIQTYAPNLKQEVIDFFRKEGFYCL